MAFRRPVVASTAASSMAITMAGVRDKAGVARRFSVFRFLPYNRCVALLSLLQSFFFLFFDAVMTR